VYIFSIIIRKNPVEMEEGGLFPLPRGEITFNSLFKVTEFNIF
jgi:hypothetical protein